MPVKEFREDIFEKFVMWQTVSGEYLVKTRIHLLATFPRARQNEDRYVDNRVNEIQCIRGIFAHDVTNSPTWICLNCAIFKGMEESNRFFQHDVALASNIGDKRCTICKISTLRFKNLNDCTHWVNYLDNNKLRYILKGGIIREIPEIRFSEIKKAISFVNNYVNQKVYDSRFQN